MRGGSKSNGYLWRKSQEEGMACGKEVGKSSVSCRNGKEARGARACLVCEEEWEMWAARWQSQTTQGFEAVVMGGHATRCWETLKA